MDKHELEKTFFCVDGFPRFDIRQTTMCVFIMIYFSQITFEHNIKVLYNEILWEHLPKQILTMYDIKHLIISPLVVSWIISSIMEDGGSLFKPVLAAAELNCLLDYVNYCQSTVGKEIYRMLPGKGATIQWQLCYYELY